MARLSRYDFQGLLRTKRILKALPEAVRGEMVEELTAAGAYGARLMKAAAPLGKTGQLREAITFKVSARQLVMRVGIIGKRVARRVFYARILEFGRKAQVIKATRRSASGAATSYAMKISAIPRERFNFVFGAPRTATKERAITGLRALYGRALKKASAGASDA